MYALLKHLRVKKYEQKFRKKKQQTICIFENKDADQLRGYPEADQRLCFHYTTLPLLLKSEISSFLPD